MATNEPGQSSGSEGTKEKKIQYRLFDLSISSTEQRGTGKLQMPSTFTTAWLKPASGELPTVILDVKRPGQDLHCITLMRNCLHKNILHARAIMEKGQYLLVCTEYYTGALSTYFASKDPFIPDSGGIEIPSMIPSSKFQKIAIQMLDGLGALWMYGKYHGNLTMESTCYHHTAKDDVVVKLTGFECKGKAGKLSRHQSNDLGSVGTVLRRISQMAKKLNGQGWHLDCYQLDHLIERLKEVAEGDLNYAISDIKKEPFFWTTAERKSFFVSVIPLAMQQDAVRMKVDGAEKLCTLPWDNDDYDGFLALMVDYRKVKEKKPYDYTSRIGYVYFISGIYTHEVELKNQNAAVDDIVMSVNPRLFQLLYSLVPRDPRRIDQ